MNSDSDILPKQLQNYIDRTADSLAHAYSTASNTENDEKPHIDGFDSPWDYYEETKTRVFDHKDVNYWVEGSGRIVCVIGQTFSGEMIIDNARGVAVKFQPWLLEEDENRCDNAMNLREIEVWEEAVQREDTDLFATIFDYSESGHWIVMEQCLPIYSTGPPRKASSHDYIRDGPDKTLIDEFRNRFAERGWYEHDYKHGNLGYDANGTIVLIDYGSYTKFEGESNTETDS